MKRRDFLTKGTLAVGLASSHGLLKPLLAGETDSATTKSTKTSQQTAKAPEEIRSSEYLRRSKNDKFLPKMPAFAATYLSPDVKISPMPLEERLRRGIVPRRGFCSKIPGTTVSEGLTSGNGRMNIEVTCDPYSEQILFHHESLLMPWKRPFEAPKVADIFPQVRQMVLDGKYQEAIEFAFKEMEKGPIKRNTMAAPHRPGIPDASRFSENCVGQGLSPHRRFREQ